MRLSDLLGGVAVPDLLDARQRRAPCHVRGRAETAARLLTPEGLADAILEGSPTARLLATAALSAFPGRAPGARLRRYRDRGLPLVLNGARGVSPGIDELERDLAAVFDALVWPNVYDTGRSATPFDVHFDTHDVIAVQCDGLKEWRLWPIRAECPPGLPDGAPAIAQALERGRAQAVHQAPEVAVTRPGDLLFIPRGQFHNAASLSRRSLHVSFALER